MSMLTIHLEDDTAERLTTLAHARGVSLNSLIEEMSLQALAAWNTEQRFHETAATGNIQQALSIHDRLDGRSAE
ncbi:CopG family transcriptional regulator [Skermanella stibiiresistens SB22]|uniref:CopG family transcriptional regulator n=1 Tax=Skermanella stibiiresistens SB22 TaxID=1385369 RepID=W9HFG7_9PROT|nr:CopG family transcriptional regulator [Skermanella stibiiresistens]EWY42613.1 CopG family transcriptional regulator [Skermanella stibiiresistens SB22]